MPRFARPHVAGGLFHIISRFHNGEYLLDLPGARGKYLEFLGKAIHKSDARLLAYCLMSNHVHLVMQLGTRPLGNITRAIHAGWVNWLNPASGRRGTAMADRPDSLLCQSETYGRALVRYVHNNPVRARIVEFAAQSDWSSHRAYLGIEEPPEWLSIEPLLGLFDPEPSEARRKFSRFVDDGRMEERQPVFSGRASHELARRVRRLVGGPVEVSYPVLGSDEFLLRSLGEQVDRLSISAHMPEVDIGAGDVLRAVCDVSRVDAEAALGLSRERTTARVRKITAWVWCEKLGRKQVDIASMFNVRPAAVTKMISGWRAGGVPLDVSRIIEQVFDLLLERVSDHCCRPAASDRGQKAGDCEVKLPVRVRVLHRVRNTATRLRKRSGNPMAGKSKKLKSQDRPQLVGGILSRVRCLPKRGQRSLVLNPGLDGAFCFRKLSARRGPIGRGKHSRRKR